MKHKARLTIKFKQRGRMGGPVAAGGPGGYCVCPKCDHKTKHTVGEPCTEVKCTECGTLMVREEEE